MNFSSFVKSAAFILSVSIASLAVSYTIFAWLNPSQDPPAVNTTTPINVGGTNQSKSGDLSIGSGLKIWLSKLGDSFALKNDSGTTLLVIGQQDGNTGIGTTSPDAKLEVAGQVKITGGAPAADKLLVSDATGLGSWKTATEIGIGGTLPAGTSGQTLRHNGAAWIGDGNLYNDGTNVGIGTATPSAKLDLNGQIRIRGGAPALGKVLVSDNAGLATWQNPATGIVPSDCGTGTAVLGIDASGQLLCGRQVIVATCSGNKFAKGVDASGNIICGDLPPLCITTSCATLGYTCGAWPNGCGGALSCGVCGVGSECSVGTCKVSCIPKTCADLGYSCGNPSDGCGGTLNCGSCGAQICVSGTCKDANCKGNAPNGAKKIFVTSVTYAGTDTNTDAKADAICADRASKGGLSGTFDAFAYLGVRLPENVLPAGKAFYNGQITGGHCEWKLVAANPNNFWNLPLLAPIRYDEFGNDPGSSVWTGYKSAGGSTRTLLAPLGTSCCGFTDFLGKLVSCWPCVGGKGVDAVNKCGSFSGPYGDARAYYGLNSATDNSWSGIEWYQRTNVNCAYPNGCNRTNEVLPTCQAVTRSLYCVEQ